jgi:hypothetical protein
VREDEQLKMVAFQVASHWVGSQLGLGGTEHLLARGVGALTPGKCAALGTLRPGLSGLQTATSPLASRAPRLESSAMARLGAITGGPLFLFADDRRANAS